MSLKSNLNDTLDVLLSSQSHSTLTAEQLIRCIDLTLLDENTSIESLTQLNKLAQQNQVAAVCVFSKHFKEFRQLDITRLATVINFPQGDEELSVSLGAIDSALDYGANEIDYVFPYQMYLEGKRQEALIQCQAIINYCKKHHLTLKIILETGVYPGISSIYDVSKNLIELGCDFLKTSTGKVPKGASLPAAFAILSAIKDSNSDCGLKVSGGIKTPVQATNYAKLAELIINKKIDKTWFRIGASSLLNELLK